MRNPTNLRREHEELYSMILPEMGEKGNLDRAEDWA